MEDNFLKTGDPITYFKSGDVVTRLHPSRGTRRVMSEFLGGSHEEVYEDRSYIGDPMKFIGIFNNQIWLERLTNKFFSTNVIRLNLAEWGDNWALFEMPEGYNYNTI